jgi:hypothetical protein
MISTFNFNICYVNSFHLFDRELNLGSKGLSDRCCHGYGGKSQLMITLIEL